MTEHDETIPPAATDPPTGWQCAPTPPAWVLEQIPTATGWRNAGERRWRATLPEPFDLHLLVLVNTAGNSFTKHAIDLDYGDPMNDEIVDQTFSDLQDQLDHEALPECVKPDCTEKGTARMVAAEIGHLAGKVYAAGDEIRMCQPHAYDVYRAGEGLGSIAEWLRPDAEILDPWLTAQYRYYGADDDYIHRTRARLPRMLRPAGDPR